MLTTGSQGAYQWLVTDQEFDFLKLCPEVIVGKYIAVTSIDSGEFVPNDSELKAGWQSRCGIAYSPRILNVEELPREGWDEWYIFTNPADLGTSHLTENIFEVPHESGHVSDFVNYRFALHDTNRRVLVDLFWQQLAWIRPESYVADSDYLNFVTADKTLFTLVHDAVKSVT
jgi:hypothetical protein